MYQPEKNKQDFSEASSSNQLLRVSHYINEIDKALISLPKRGIAYTTLWRGVFGVDPAPAIAALALKDRALPFLRCNKLRAMDRPGEDMIEKFNRCANFTRNIVAEVKEDPVGYGKKTVECTRFFVDEDTRKKATGILFLGGGDNTGFSAFSYGHTHALDWIKGFKSAVPAANSLPLSNQAILTFEVDNRYELDIRGEYLEAVLPSCVLNSQIKSITIGLSLTQVAEFQLHYELLKFVPRSDYIIDCFKLPPRINNSGKAVDDFTGLGEHLGEIHFNYPGEIVALRCGIYNNRLSELFRF